MRLTWMPTKMSDGIPTKEARIWAIADHCSSDTPQIPTNEKAKNYRRPLSSGENGFGPHGLLAHRFSRLSDDVDDNVGRRQHRHVAPRHLCYRRPHALRHPTL